MRWLLIVIYIWGAASAGAGVDAGFRHQCGRRAPTTIIFGAGALWPIAVPWAAMKNGSPLWRCAESQEMSPDE
jgi:hypothetical protein